MLRTLSHVVCGRTASFLRVPVAKDGPMKPLPSFVGLALLLHLGSPALSQPQLDPICDSGNWYAPYNWNNAASPTFNAIHVGLIPRGAFRGKLVILSWDGAGAPCTFSTITCPSPTGPLYQAGFWAILDPEVNGGSTPAFYGPYCGPNLEFNENHCVGQSWTVDGRWFVAGGQNGLVCPPGLPTGGRHAWLYDPDVAGLVPPGPPEGAWFQATDMDQPRYYPTVLLTGVDTPVAPYGEMIVAGGSNDAVSPPSAFLDNYEVFRPGPRVFPPPPPASNGTWQTHSGGMRLFPGPPFANGRFKWFPRLFLLPNGWMALSGIDPVSSRAVHPVTSTAQWTQMGTRTIPGGTGYHAAILYPNLNPNYTSTLMNMGGPSGAGAPCPTPASACGPSPASGSQPTTIVEWCNAAAGGPGAWPNGWSWNSGPPSGPGQMSIARQECCAVILPDASIMVFGDGNLCAGGITQTPRREPEIFRNGRWGLMQPETSVRDHHAWALLLPSGRVLSGAGNHRCYDFQLYDPPYICSNIPRPAWGVLPTVLNRGQNYILPVTLPPGTSVGKVVLIRPGSITHHADMDQRYVELPVVTSTTTTVTVTAPAGPPDPTAPPGSLRAPLGYYMIFLLTNGGIPSVADFVQFL